MRNQCDQRFNKRGGHCWGAGSEAPATGGKEGLGAERIFTAFTYYKKTRSSTLSYRKRTYRYLQ